MEVKQVLHMNGGEGETSYASNSTLQRTVISKAKPVLEESIQQLCNTTGSPCLKVADLGCSSGPNTLLVITEIVDIAYKTCGGSPCLQIFLNDLPQNDFNSIFRSLPAFYNKLKEEKGVESEPCFVTGMPGSFYGRLFPNNSLNFVHSSYSIHFLSQVPRGLESEAGTPLNKGNIYLGKTSPCTVKQAYWKQFRQDFSLFLTLRSDELIPGGRMLLTFMGRRSDDPSIDENCTPWTLLSSVLNDMVMQGLVEEQKLDSFNLPYYAASVDEIRDLVEEEGSFDIHRLEIFHIAWDGTMKECSGNPLLDKFARSQQVALCIRAVAEPMLVSYFGEAIMDDLFSRFKVKVTELLMEEEVEYMNIVVSLTNKGFVLGGN